MKHLKASGGFIRNAIAISWSHNGHTDQKIEKKTFFREFAVFVSAILCGRIKVCKQTNMQYFCAAFSTVDFRYASS